MSSLLALRIAAVQGGTLIFDDRRYEPVDVGPAFLALHEPEVGGYYLIDDHGHGSFASTLPDDVPAPAAALPVKDKPALHPDDHFRYDWLEACLTILHQQGEALIAGQDALAARIAKCEALQGDRHV